MAVRPFPLPPPIDLSPLRPRLIAIRAEVDALLEAIEQLQPSVPLPPPQLLFETPEEYAEREGVTMESAYRWIKAGMPHRRVGRFIRIDVKAAVAWHNEGGLRAAVKRSAQASARRAPSHRG